MTFRFLFVFFSCATTPKERSRAFRKFVNYDFPFTKRVKLSLLFFSLLFLFFFFVSFSPQKKKKLRERDAFRRECFKTCNSFYNYAVEKSEETVARAHFKARTEKRVTQVRSPL